MTSMNYEGYDIVPYHPEFLDGVLQVLRHLWGNDHEKNRSYFHWKYTLNPYTEKELGIVALHKNKVVGFRGYFATRWKINETDKKFITLCPGDLCIEPDHRRRHIAMLTGQAAMRDYTETYPIFFSFSSNKKSTQLAFKMGYTPLASRQYLNQYTIPGLFKYILLSGRPGKGIDISVPTGDFGNLEISEHPKPSRMADLVLRQTCRSGKIYLDQDEDFFKWRFNNVRKQYVFYYYKENEEIKGYMVVRVTPGKKRGFIIDYVVPDESSAFKLVAFPIKNNQFNVLSISRYSVAGPMAGALMKLKFKSTNIIESVKKTIEGDWPLLVRPVRQNASEKDYYVDGIDIRMIDNWSLKEICSDGS